MTATDMVAQDAEETTSGVDLTRPSGSRAARNGCASVFMVTATLLAVIPLAWVLWSAVSKGIGSLVHTTWWTHAMDSADQAKWGALHAIIGTVEIGVITSVISVPIALLTAIYLVEYARGRKIARVISFAVDVLTGVPSIVAALFVFALVVTTLGGHQSAWAASLALVILMVPTVLRSTEEMLKLVPDSLREASFALGVSKWRTIVSVVLPTSISGIITGIVLGLARVMGETAPLIVLLQFNQYIDANPGSSTFATLPTIISNAYTQGSADTPTVWGAALTLIILVMGLNLVAKAVSRRFLRRMGK
ncbi:MAG: phosphate ABC transporter permease PstA [Acidipropionibacterium acidipropionici]|jgi:phosphate transport system permease protein|uniref:Phosphate transport system permease protein PstA n=1 Tax=Acidipropionibacterium acidipropionici (strain ATCC 4875 / DSM 20272 / JCM 6432 / NBRC 12425 / NCIMB 8070 / 4) TaxID=1171373 RepID=K7RR61_ACIA4|nr:phosphate ABC transporter permease PstA [Acidipropionibacterium acidipropionici]AFV90529.1 Phosphate ABC transporter, permease protein PstA [Acidipropionibacterium acidipropionici ATCC 4875]ALN15258.1 phosphate ABC transporter permease [Acidipropionibacterium acidipropionici]APZ08993.1 phosphate ABC transporter, permease protein PstA [Acidipropionibacterium acidipropionici]MDN6555341.1 phosphate ABC transporter permease PstA [Acidipropionibacterium acidipropionici]QCV94240.1 phosphate ABC t